MDSTYAVAAEGSARKRQMDPIQFSYENTSDKIQRASAFQIFNKNPEEVKTESVFSNAPDLEHFKRYYFDKPHLITRVRMQSVNLRRQMEHVVSITGKNPTGQAYWAPAFNPLMFLNTKQFQEGILDIPYAFLLDALDADLEFDIEPKTTLIITFYFECEVERSAENIKRLRDLAHAMNLKNGWNELIYGLVVENRSEKIMEVDLFHPDYKKNNWSSTLIVRNIFRPKEKDGIAEDWKMEPRGADDVFNALRISVTESPDRAKQLVQPIRFDSGKVYYPAAELDGDEIQSGLVDMKITGEAIFQQNTMRVTILPNSRVVYLFLNEKEREQRSTIQQNKKFTNVFIENNSDMNLVDCDLLSMDCISDSITKQIGKANMALSENQCQFDHLRIMYSGDSFLKNSIEMNQNDKTFLIDAAAHLSNASFGKVISIPLSKPFVPYKDKLFVTVPNGEWINVVLENSHGKKIELYETEDKFFD